jgi:hypothetical protein
LFREQSFMSISAPMATNIHYDKKRPLWAPRTVSSISCCDGAFRRFLTWLSCVSFSWRCLFFLIVLYFSWQSLLQSLQHVGFEQQVF